ncbi:MAG: DUF5658 family protein [Planctomycetota bacterium]|nr:DUF5658 family protein [Planctomycetota bacterium]
MIRIHEPAVFTEHHGASLPRGRHAADRTSDVLFPVGYTWLVLAGALDVIITNLMLHLGAVEVNIVANAAIGYAGLWGLILLKFSVVAGVLWICEYVGRRQLRTARALVGTGVAINLLPVVFSFAQLILFHDAWVEDYMHG